MPVMCHRRVLEETASSVAVRGGLLVTLRRDGSGDVWSFNPGESLPKLWHRIHYRPPSNPLAYTSARTLDLAESGNLLVTEWFGGTALVWRLGEDHAELCSRITTPTGEISALAFSPDDVFLAVGGDTGANIWDIGTSGVRSLSLYGTGLAPEGDPYADVTRACFWPDSSRLALGLGRGVRLWQITRTPRLSAQLLPTTLIHRRCPEVGWPRFSAIKVSQPSDCLVTAVAGGSVAWWDPYGFAGRENPEPVREEVGIGDRDSAGFLSPNVGWTWWRDDNIELWQVVRNAGIMAVRTLGQIQLEGIEPQAFSSDLQFCVTLEPGNELVLWRVWDGGQNGIRF
jgi:WD40 repeat protein